MASVLLAKTTNIDSSPLALLFMQISIVGYIFSSDAKKYPTRVGQPAEDVDWLGLDIRPENRAPKNTCLVHLRLFHIFWSSKVTARDLAQA